MKNVAVVSACAFLFAVMGCGGINEGEASGETFNRSNDTTYVVTVGMERSHFAGACSGAGLDAKRMTSLLSRYSPHVTALSDETATKSAVRHAMTVAVENADLFIFYYSGHGGQGRFWDTGADEDDGMDEYLCLYDTYMRDNEVWEIISKAKGRVMCIFDACHSENLYRTVAPITLRMANPLAVTHIADGGINLLVWAGCPANTYSYGSSQGGMMTNTLLKYFNEGMSYDVLWNRIEGDSGLKRHEIVQRTIMRDGFGERPIFQ